MSLVPQCSQGASYECFGPVENCGSSGPLALCVCDQKVDGGEFCWENFFCDGAQACASSSDCPRGYACATSRCGTTCAPACGTNLAQVQQGGKTATG